MGNYDDIINLPHHQSTKRPHMTLHNRAAQFAPFAALTGYAEEVAETARLTDKKIFLADNEISKLNEQLQYIAANLNMQWEIVITHFVPDQRKDGGAYVDKIGIIKKIDDIEHKIIFTDGEEILIENIYSIEVE